LNDEPVVPLDLEANYEQACRDLGVCLNRPEIVIFRTHPRQPGVEYHEFGGSQIAE